MLFACGTADKPDAAFTDWARVPEALQFALANSLIMVAMSFNSDIGDSWEWADDPSYPEKYSAPGIRIGVNFAIYSLTH